MRDVKSQPISDRGLDGDDIPQLTLAGVFCVDATSELVNESVS